jgi:hypothetical protein
VTGVWRKLDNEERHNLYSSPNIIRMIKSRRIRWAGHVARMGRPGMHIGYYYYCYYLFNCNWALARWQLYNNRAQQTSNTYYTK